jgi:malate synthase
MEDLATDRIYRLMIAQRLRHHVTVPRSPADATAVAHTPESVHECFEAQFARLVADLPKARDAGNAGTLGAASAASEEMIRHGWFNPV